VIARAEIKLAVKPQTVVFPAFSVSNGSTQPLYAQLTGSESDSVKIVSAQSTSELIRVEVNHEGFDGDPSRQIRFTVLPGMSEGRFRERVVLRTDSASISTLSLFVTGEALGNIKVTPKHLPFGMIHAGRSVRRTIRLQSTQDGFSFNVLGVKSTVDELVTDVTTITPGKEYRVNVVLPDDYPHAVVRGEIIITTDDKDQETVTVRVFGRAAGPMQKRQPAHSPLSSNPDAASDDLPAP
jgi:hypothetical protein